MTQPSGQVNLNVSSPYYGYFYYAQGSNGLWDARNGALLSKTGSAGMSTDGGNNVVLGDGSTRYSLGSLLSINPPWTLIVRVKLDSGASSNAMLCGNNSASTDFVWMDDGSGNTKVRAESIDGGTYPNTGGTTMATYAFVVGPGDFIQGYKNGSAWGSSKSFAASKLILNSILSGYTGNSYSLKGALEFLHIMPITASAADISSLYSDPYQALQSGATTHSTSGALSSDSAIIVGTASRTGAAVTHSTSGALVSGSAVITATASRTASGVASFSTPPIKNNAGQLLANISGWTVNVYNASTGALVVQKTGLTTTAAGVLVVSDAALSAGTTYAYEPSHATYGRRLPTGTA